MEFDATFIIAVLSFIVFVFIMNKIFYAPVLKIMKERDLFIENNYNETKEVKLKTESQINFREETLEKQREASRLNIASETKKLKQEHSGIIEKFKNEQYNIIPQEKENLKNSAIQAKDVLKNNITDIAKDISFKILGNDFDVDKIDEFKTEEQ